MAMLLAGVLLVSGVHIDCFEARITGYVKSAGNPTTYDGTSIWTEEPIVAASWSVPIGAIVVIDGLGIFRVADRGRLGPHHFDIPVDTRAQAYALTGVRDACVFTPE